MARATFDGPVLVGDTRFGPLRNVGTAELVQGIQLNFANTTQGTAGYGGSSGIFAESNSIPNTAGVVYNPGTNPATVQTITADTAATGTIYRGCVFYVPVGSDLHDVLIDVQALPTVTSGTFGNLVFYVSNKFETSTAAYFQTGAGAGLGRTALSTFTATQMANQQATSNDIITGGSQPNVSQVVVTCAINGTTMTGLSGGIINITLRYGTPDTNIGNLTTYPYGNLD